MPAPCSACHHHSQAACQTWSDLSFHDTLLPVALGATSPGSANGCRHLGRKSSPTSVASSPRPGVIECLVHAITASRRRVPKPSDAFHKALDDLEQDASHCVPSNGDGVQGDTKTVTSHATAELKRGASAAQAPPKPRLIRVSRRCTVRRDVSPLDTALPARCRYSLGESSCHRRVRWADENGAPADLVSVHLIRPRLRNCSPLPTSVPARSILKGAAS